MIEVVDRFGLPIVALTVIVLAIRGFARWLAPRLDRIIERHEALLGRMEDQLDDICTRMERMEERQKTVIDEFRSFQDRFERSRS